MLDSTSRRPALPRRRYIVDPSFQQRLIRTLLFIWLAQSVFYALLLSFFYEGYLRQFYELVARPGRAPALSPSALFALAVGLIFAIGFALLLTVAIYLSNQIAGPLYRTKQGLERVGRGDLSFHLQVRKTDLLREVPVAFNNMLASLRHQAETELSELRAIEASDDDPAEWRRLVQAQLERKEIQLGLGGGAGEGSRDRAVLSVTVH
jgi:methyl-accepting chemotaxis protein